MTPEQKRAVDRGVFDKTAGKWLARVRRRKLNSGEYFRSVRGLYSFSPADKGHKLMVFYDLVGPRVSILGGHQLRRA